MELTDRQKAILNWAALNDVDDWRKIYTLASDRPPKFYDGKNIVAQVSNWKRLAKVQTYYQEQRAKAIQLRKAAATLNPDPVPDGTKEAANIQTEGGSENAEKGAKTAKKQAINYLDRQELMMALNRSANEISDIKQRTDILKLIADLSRMKESDKGNDQIRRFYLPLSCQNCELYRHAKEITADKAPDAQEMPE